MNQMRIKTLSTGSQETAHHESDAQVQRELNFPLIHGIGDCQYKNQVSFEKILIGGQDCSKIKIVNQLCSDKGNILEKVTQIKFGDQVITIRDQYNFQTLGARIMDNSCKKRIHIFKKPLTPKLQQGETKSRLTKNLSKNFIKAFLNYLDDIKQDSNRELIQCKIKLYANKQRYNNIFIQKVVDDEQLEHYFRDFLENHAQAWIENSKIRDKKVHMQAINVFLRLKNSRRNNMMKPDSTKSYSNQQKQQFEQYQHNHDQSVHFNRHIGSQRDSVLANQSQRESLHEERVSQ